MRQDLSTRLAEAQRRFDEQSARLERAGDDLQRASERARQLHSVITALAGSLTPAQVASAILHDGIRAVGANAGALALVSPDQHTVRIVDANGFPKSVVDHWAEFPLAADIPIAVAIRTGQAVWLGDEQARRERFPEVARQTPRSVSGSWAVLPLAVRERSVGALALGFERPGERTPDEQTLLMLIAQQCAVALERARLYEGERNARVRAEFAERQIGFLADASARLSASLDYRIALGSLARLIVPEFADWCVIHGVGDNDKFQLLAAVHRDRASTEALRRVERRWPPDANGDDGIGAVLRGGTSELLSEIPEGFLERSARSEVHHALLRSLDVKSRMTVPIRSRERGMGVMVIGSSATGRRYTPADLAVAEELANRAGQAIDNAQLYQTVRLASQAKSDFLAVMSHELRTPLNAILGYADLLMMGVPEAIPDSSRGHVGRLRFAAEHLLQLVDEVLSYSRLEAKKETLRVGTTDLGVLVWDCLALIEPVAARKGLTLRHVIPQPPPVIKTDGWKLRHIINNLLSNAVKFTAFGEINLHASIEGETLVVQVKDTGIGIPAEHLDRVFDAFWQVEQSSTRRFEGTGLGLGVARELARLLGGDLNVSSEVGVGSTFTLRIPVHAVDATDYETDTE